MCNLSHGLSESNLQGGRVRSLEGHGVQGAKEKVAVIVRSGSRPRFAKLEAEKSKWQKEQQQGENDDVEIVEAAEEGCEKDDINYWRKLREIHRGWRKTDDNAEVKHCIAEIDRITMEVHLAKPASQQISLDEREIQRHEKKIEAQKSKSQGLEGAAQETKKAQSEHLERIASNEAKLEEARRKKREDSTRALLESVAKQDDAASVDPILSQIIDEAMHCTPEESAPLGSFGNMALGLTQARQRKQQAALAAAADEAAKAVEAARLLAAQQQTGSGSANTELSGNNVAPIGPPHQPGQAGNAVQAGAAARNLGHLQAQMEGALAK